jgi:hypothetical protein
MGALQIDHGLQDPLTHPNEQRNPLGRPVLMDPASDFEIGFLNDIRRVEPRSETGVESKRDDFFKARPEFLETLGQDFRPILTKKSLGIDGIGLASLRFRHKTSNPEVPIPVP